MTSLEKRLAALEKVRGHGYEHWTDEQIDARISWLRIYLGDDKTEAAKADGDHQNAKP